VVFETSAEEAGTDATPPILLARLAGTAGTGGWYRSNVELSFEASDAESGIVSTTGCDTLRFAEEGRHTSPTCRATNGAGLTTELSTDFGIDRTPPSLQIESPLAQTYLPRGAVPLAWAASDALSGIMQEQALLDGVPVSRGDELELSLFPPGSHTLQVTVTDLAGNPATLSLSFTVEASPGDPGPGPGQACRLAWVADPCSCERLLDQWDTVQAALAANQTDEARDALLLYLHLLDELRGSRLLERAYAELRAEALELLRSVVPFGDVSGPVIRPHLEGLAGADGWYRSNVTVSFDAGDPESGIASSAGCEPTTLIDETSGQTLTCSVTNGAGLSAQASVTVKIDRTPPLIVFAIPEARSYAHAATLRLDWRSEDTLSGGGADGEGVLDGVRVANGDVVDLLSLPLGIHRLEVAAADAAGNSAGGSVTFQAAAELGGLSEATDRACLLGWIATSCTCGSLRTAVERARSQIAGGATEEAAQALMTYVAELADAHDAEVLEQTYQALRAEALALIEQWEP
jgi:hypothetical protein